MAVVAEPTPRQPAPQPLGQQPVDIKLPEPKPVHAPSAAAKASKEAIVDKGAQMERLNRASQEAERGLNRWRTAKAAKDFQGKRQFWESLPANEQDYWNGTILPQAPDAKKFDTPAKAAEALSDSMFAVRDSGRGMDRAVEHYANRGLSPLGRMTPERLRKVVSEEAKRRFERVEGLGRLYKGSLDPNKESPLDELNSDNIYQETSKAVSYGTYLGYASNEDERKIVIEAVREAAKPYLGRLKGGKERVNILEKHGVIVADGPAEMSEENVAQIGAALENTPPHIMRNTTLNVVSDNSHRKGMRDGGNENITAGQFENRTIRFILPLSDQNAMNHEIGHYAHLERINPEKLFDYIKLGGWKFTNPQTGLEEEVSGKNLTLAKGWSKPPLTSVARKYGQEHPVEDLGTMHEAYTGGTRDLMEKAMFESKGGDDTLKKKMKWLIENVFTDPETGKVSVYTRVEKDYRRHEIKKEDAEDPERLYKSLDGLQKAHEKEWGEKNRKRDEELRKGSRSVIGFDGSKILEELEKKKP